MQCTKCGTQNNHAGKYCQKCGQLLNLQQQDIVQLSKVEAGASVGKGQSSNHQKKFGKTKLVQLILISIVAGIAASSLAWPIFSPIKLISVSSGGGMGGGGGCDITIYDSNGFAHDTIFFHSTDFIGRAPLYDVNTSKYCNKDSDGCYICPDKLSRVDVETDGVPVYPLVLSANLAQNWMGSGESDILEITARIEKEYKDKYPGNMEMIKIYPYKDIDVQLALQAPNFNIDRTPNDSLGEISVSKDLVRKWVISPKENALGEQSILATLYSGNKSINTIRVSLEVRSLSGFNPVTLSVITTVSVFIGGLVKPLFEMIKDFVSQKITPPKPKKKKK
jgi:hypothetical protein